MTTRSHDTGARAGDEVARLSPNTPGAPRVATGGHRITVGSARTAVAIPERPATAG